jgi:hypothetical protein
MSFTFILHINHHLFHTFKGVGRTLVWHILNFFTILHAMRIHKLDTENKEDDTNHHARDRKPS